MNPLKDISAASRAIIENAREFLSLARVLVDDRVKMHEHYQEVFSTPQGQEVLRHICAQGHVFATTFVRNDPHETMLREGERRLALSILRHVVRDHATFQRMAEVEYNKKLQEQDDAS